MNRSGLMMDKNYLSKEEIDRLLESKFVQTYREPTKEEYRKILYILNGLRSEHMKEQRKEIVEKLNKLINHIDEMNIQVEDTGQKKYVSICAESEHLILHDSFFLTLFDE